MAREFAKIKASIWQDDDFRNLPPMAQHLYFVILTDPELSYCGVTDWRPKRMAPKSAEWTLDEIQAAGSLLTDARHLIIDDSTEEVLIRSFLRHDGVMAHNKLCISAMNAFSAVASNTIRGVIVHELNRLRNEFPEWPAWQRQPVTEVLKRNALAPGLATPLAPGLADGLASGLGATPASGLASALQQQQQQQHTTATEESKDSSLESRKRAIQIPDDWKPTDKDREYAKTKNVDVDREAERFVNHWQANGTTRKDWSATWRNWIMKAEEMTPRNITAIKPKPKPGLYDEAYGF